MSRSYKKHPGWSGKGHQCWREKRASNKRVRHTLNLQNGCAYKKVYNSWSIMDYNFRYYSREEYIRIAKRWDHLKKIWHGWMK